MTENKTNLPADFANLFLKGVERAAELQKKSLDAAMQQNAEVISSYKKGPLRCRHCQTCLSWQEKLLRVISKHRKA